MPQVDYSTWVTKADAAAAIGVHTKQIERWAKEGKLQTAKYKRPSGGTPIVVYHPAEVERIAKQRNPETQVFVVPAPKEPAGNGAQAVTLAPLPGVWPPPPPSADQFLDALTAIVKARDTTSETSETRLGLWLTLKQAVDYSGLPEAELVHLMKSGELKHRNVGKGRRGGQYRICKAVLEELR